jgi:hypothetical protein
MNGRRHVGSPEDKCATASPDYLDRRRKGMRFSRMFDPASMSGSAPHDSRPSAQGHKHRTPSTIGELW